MSVMKKKVSLADLDSIEKKGWQVKKSDRDKFAAQQITMDFSKAALSIAESMQKISTISDSLEKSRLGFDQISAIATALDIQNNLAQQLLNEMKSLQERPSKWTLNIVKRDAKGFTEKVEVTAK